MTTRRLAVVMAALAMSACGDDTTTTTTTTSTTTTTTTTTTTSTTTVPSSVLEQPAVWPAPHVVMTTPEAAARDFVERALGVPAVLGEFRWGDQRSGEIEVLLAAEGGDTDQRWPRGVLFLRRLGPSDGWFVIGAASEHVTITRPAAGMVVAPGPLTVTGVGRGFEATLVVAALRPGESEPLDQQVVFGGGLEAAMPYAARLDLSRADPGDTVVLMTRGGVGLETDPGEFAALPVTVGS